MSLPGSIDLSLGGNSGHSHRPMRILIANDQEWTARSLESILASEGAEVVRAYTGRQALDRALESRPDLIVLDVQLPDISGPDVCRTLRGHPAVGWVTPIILTTAGSNGRARQLEVLEAGASDFFPQPFDGTLLLLKLRTLLRARAACDEVVQRALLDEDTGLYNVRGLEVRLGELAAEAHRRQETLACVSVSAGSVAMREAEAASRSVGHVVGQAIRGVVRASDVVARVGAADFVILASQITPELAHQMVERLRRYLTASAGLAGQPILLEAGHALIDPESALREPAARARSLGDIQKAVVTPA